MKNNRNKNKNDTSSKGKFKVKPKRESKKATKGVLNGIDYDSLEEMYVLQWLFELKNAGYIISIQRSESFLLCDSVVNNYAEQLKTSSRPKTQTLLHGHSYTPEFIVEWNFNKSKDKFTHLFSSGKKVENVFIAGHHNSLNPVTYIEVKPMFDQNNMERLFKLNQKWMWDKHGIFVNLVKVNELFPKTFTPRAYLTTPSGRPRMLKWKEKSLFQFLNNK
jgi:hypothetical protein